MSSTCEVIWLAQRDYREAWAMQQKLAEQRLTGEITDTLLLLEHPPTLTLGRNADKKNLLADNETLARHVMSVVETDRGGDITYHGPGQLVGYPILNLQQPPHTPDLHLYLRNIEEALIRTLFTFGIEAGRFPPHTGVWTGLSTTQPKKVAAIGIKASRWITQHGFALNICPNLAHFDLIVPCGISEYGVTSVSHLLSREVSVGEVMPSVIRSFGEVFQMEMRVRSDHA